MKIPHHCPRATALVLSALFSVTAFAADVNTSTQKSTDFQDGNLSPFSVCTTTSPSYVQPFTKNGAPCAKFFWSEAGYNGTRVTKGAEACGDLNLYKDGWYAFKIFVPASGYPTNKKTIIGQIFSEGGCSSWAATFNIENNELWIEHRVACVAPTRTRIASSIPRDTWVRLVCQFSASHASTGFMKVWWNGASQGSPTYSRTNINFAFGDWEGDTLKSSGDSGVFGSATDNMIRLKFGMYCFDDANYTDNETRVLYYDNVVHIKGNPSNAWSACNF